MKIPSVKKYFYQPTFGLLNYVVDSDGDALYLIDKEQLPEEIKGQLVGGNAGNKEYSDYVSLNDVYGVTSDLKVYYCSGGKDTIYGVTKDDLDKDNPQREVFGTGSSSDNEYKNELKELGFDKNGDGEISAEEAQSVKELTIGGDSSITSLEGLYNLVSLQKLIIENKELKNLVGIENCPLLYYVFFNGSTIEDYSAMSALGNRLTTLYFYNIDDEEFSKACNGIKGAKYTNLEKLAVVGNYAYIYPQIGNMIETYNGVTDKKCKKTISTLAPLSCLSDETKKAVKYLSINNNNLKDEDLKSISGFTNLYLLRAEYNSFTDNTTNTKYGLKTLDGLEDMKKLTYLYASNNLLGTGCDEEEGKKNCLASLKDKNKKNSGSSNGEGLYYVNLKNNENLRYVDDLINNTDIKYLYLLGCSKSMNVNKIASIITGCGTNYDLPCKFLNGENYVWTDYYSLNGENEKEKLTVENLRKDLKDNKFITALNLGSCKNDGITNKVLNEILKTMPNLKYVVLNDTNLESLDFCELVPENNYAYCPELVELDIRDTYVTDISDLENLVTENDKYPNGKDFGTLRLSDSLRVDEKNERIPLDLSTIQDVINKINGRRVFGSAGDSGLVITSFNTLKSLEKCSKINRIYSSQYSRMVNSHGETLHLTSGQTFNSIRASGWEVRVDFDGTIEENLTLDQSFPWKFGHSTKINRLC